MESDEKSEIISDKEMEYLDKIIEKLLSVKKYLFIFNYYYSLPTKDVNLSEAEIKFLIVKAKKY